MIARTSWLIAFVVGVLVVAGVCAGTSMAFFPLSATKIDLSDGERVFARRCAVCHTIGSDAPDRSGPSLHDIGRIAGSRLPGVSAEQFIMD